MKKLYLLLVSLICAATLVAQPTIEIDNTSGDPGGSVSVNFTVSNFTDLVGMQFSINWDPAVLAFSSLSNVNTSVRDFDQDAFNLDPRFTDGGNIVVSWFDFGAEPNSLPNGTILFTVTFDIVGSSGSSTTISISDQPRKIEVINEADEDVGLISTGGLFTASGTGGSSVRLIGSDEVGGTNETVCVEVSVQGFENIAGMQFSMNWDASFLRYSTVEGFNLDGLNTGSFNLDNVDDGKLVLQWLDPGVGVTIPDGTRIFNICFDIQGSSGSRTVQFTNDPTAIEIVDSDDDRVSFTKKDGTVTVEGGGGGGSDCNVDGFALAAENKNADANGEVCVGISVKDFVQITTAASTIEWDPLVLSNPRIESVNLSGLRDDNFNLDQGANGIASFVWFDPATEGLTLADGVIIFEICFDVIGSDGQNSSIAFTDALTERSASNPDGAIAFNQCNGSVTIGDSGEEISCVVSSPSCAGEENGSVNVTVNFGSSPYSYEWTLDGSVVSTNEDLNNIGGGTYLIKVTDGGGQERTKEVIVNEPVGAEITNATVTDATDGNNGSIALTVVGGSTPYEYLWSNGATTRDITGLASGVYSVTVTEQNGCTIEAMYSVGGGALTVAFDIKDYNGVGISCQGEGDGEITATVSGGSSPYDFTWSTGSTDPTISNLEPGEYSVTVTDGAGTTVTASGTVTEPEQLNVDVVTTSSPNNVEGTALAEVTGGTPSYSYRWNDNNPPSTTRLITNLPQGTYTVLVTDANGCSASDTDMVKPDEQECFTGRLVITPNNDNQNDEFDIACVEGTDNELEVYNRQGELVFEATNYSNGWLGIDSSGRALPDGAYYWVLRVRNNGVLEQHLGHLTIIRNLN